MMSACCCFFQQRQIYAMEKLLAAADAGNLAVLREALAAGAGVDERREERALNVLLGEDAQPVHHGANQRP